MDSSNTQQIPRAIVEEIDDGQDPDTTAQLPASLIEENDHPLAGAQATKQLEFGGDRPQRHPEQQQPATRRPSRPAPVSSPLAPAEKRPREEELGGLIPTTRQTTGRSNLSRRLDGG
jgi:hypothetical protein